MFHPDLRSPKLWRCALAALLCACSGQDTQGLDPARSAAVAKAVAEGQDLEAPLPPLGTALVWIQDGRVTLLSNQASLLRILSALQLEARFDLEVGRYGEPEGGVTLALENASLEDVLRKVLAGVPFTLRFGSKTSGLDPFPELVQVGDAETEGSDTSEPRRYSASAIPRQPSRASSTEELREQAEEEQRKRAELFAQLLDPDPEVREDAATWITPDPEGIEALVDLLHDDPDPAVRVAAASTLGDSKSPTALEALVGVLDDPDPEVVIEALDAIEWVDDPAAIPYVAALLNHGNAEVREAAEGAIYWLEP
jgi:hypothetical protein